MKYLLVLSLIVVGCASIQPLDGGEKDKTPPVVIKTFPDSASLKVNTNSFTFQFNEYVKTTNVNDLLIISPSQKKNPKLTIKGKKLTLELKDSLLPNTTYSFQFNGCIVDYNESNPLSNYRYIFSTGSYIDSLSYSGLIKQTKTNKPCDGCNLQLYISDKDSVVITEKPEYLITTKSNGTFKLENLPPANFLAYAIKDDNKNLTLDNEEEISLSTIINTSQTNQDTFFIFPYITDKKLDIKKVTDTKPGILKIASNKPIVDSVNIITNTILIKQTKNIPNDTLSIYFKPTLDSSFFTINIDTNTYKFYHLKQRKFQPILLTVSRGTLNTVNIKTTHLIDSINLDSIVLKQDSIILKTKLINKSINSVKLHTSSNINQIIKYYIYPGAIIDIEVNTNKIDSSFLTPIETGLPSLNLSIQLEDSLSKYIVYLMQQDNIIKINTIISSQLVNYKNLNPGKYRVKLIKDTNNNGIWDTGNPFTKKEAEYISISEEFELRLNWDKKLIIK